MRGSQRTHPKKPDNFPGNTLQATPTPIIHSSLIMSSLANVEAAINNRRNSSYLGSELLLHASKAVSIVIRNKVHGQTQMSKPSRTTDPVEVRFTVLGEIEVDHNVDRLNVNTPSEEIFK